MSAINLWSWDAHQPPIGWFAVNFLLFCCGLVAATRRPLRHAFAERHRDIKEAIGAAASEHARAISERNLWRNKLASVDAEVRDMLARSAADGERERQAMVDQAQAQVAGLTRDTSAQADYLQRQAEHRLHRQLLDHVVAGAQRDLQAHLSDADRSRLADAAIAELGELPAAAVRP